jgi:hypothetical protein
VTDKLEAMASHRSYVNVCILLCVFLIGLILIGAITYQNARNTRRLYTNTTCLVVNFSCIEQTCVYCRRVSGVDCLFQQDQCWGQYFSVLYPIRNGTEVTSAVGTDHHYKCKQRKEVRSLLISRTFRL